MRALQALTPEPFGDIKLDMRYVCIEKQWLLVWWSWGCWPREIGDEHRWRNMRGGFLGHHNV